MKINAYEMNPEYVDYDNYLDFDGWDDFIITGNRNYASYHTDYPLFYNIIKYCIDYNDLLDELDNIKLYGRYKNATEVIYDYLGFKPNTKQVHDIIKTLHKPGGSYYDDDDRIAELLSICEKREWTTAEIRGCCQRDYQTVFYPVDAYSDEFVNYIESIYFGTGAEYKICEYDNAPSEIDDDIVYDSDGYFNYYGSDIIYDDDLLKAEIAKEVNVKPEDINIYHVTTKQVTVESWS